MDREDARQRRVVGEHDTVGCGDGSLNTGIIQVPKLSIAKRVCCLAGRRTDQRRPGQIQVPCHGITRAEGFSVDQHEDILRGEVIAVFIGLIHILKCRTPSKPGVLRVGNSNGFVFLELLIFTVKFGDEVVIVVHQR